MDIIKAIISTLDFLLIALFLSSAIDGKDDKTQVIGFTSLSLLIGSNIFLLWCWYIIGLSPNGKAQKLDKKYRILRTNHMEENINVVKFSL